MKKDTENLKTTIHLIDLLDIYRIYYLPAIENTFFLSVSRTFTKIDHMQNQIAHFHKFHRIQIMWDIFSDQSEIKMETER